MKITHRVLIAIPIASKAAAGSIYAQRTGKSADNDSFTPGFKVGSAEWAVACWGVDEEGQKQFDQLLAAYPSAKVFKWADKDATPEQRLASLGIDPPSKSSGVDVVKGK